jgi:rubrerythrin
LAAQRSSLQAEFSQQLREGAERTAARSVEAANADTQKLLAEFAVTCQANRVKDARNTLTWLRDLDQQRQADYLNLLKKVETVAVVGEERFGQLVSYQQPDLPQNR